MKVPDKIYVNIPEDYWHPGTDKKTNMDTEYIRKDALLEWAKETYLNEKSAIRKVYYKQLIDKLNSM